MSDMDNMTGFSADLSEVINRWSQENPSGTPDFILGDFLTSVLASYNDAVQKRAEWRGETVELPAIERLVSAVEAETEKSHFQRVMDDIVSQQVQYRKNYVEFLMSNPGFVATYGDDFIVEYGEMNLSQTDKGEYDELNEYRVTFSQQVRFYRKSTWLAMRELRQETLIEKSQKIIDDLREARRTGDSEAILDLENQKAAVSNELADFALRLNPDGSLESV